MLHEIPRAAFVQHVDQRANSNRGDHHHNVNLHGKWGKKHGQLGKRIACEHCFTLKCDPIFRR
jgi:hypothetical protein